MKKKFLLVCALLGVLTISGCKDKKDDTKTTLETPQSIDVVVDKGKSFVVFDEVAGAEYYNIYINGVSVTVRGNGSGKIQFDASKLIDNTRDCVIKVNASGKNFFDSEFTEDYIYTPNKKINAPVVTVDGTVLNWSKVSGANLYEVFVSTPTSQQIFKSINNSFNFGNILDNCGEYSFYVTAISQDEQIVSSASNQIIYIHTEVLTTPNNLKVEYSHELDEELLSFVADENIANEKIEGFEFNINNSNYTVSAFGSDSIYWRDCQYGNVYIFRISAYAKSKGINIDSDTLLNVKVRANSAQAYLSDSQFSNNATYQFKSVLAQPEISIKSNGAMCDLKITTKDSKYLSKFAIYLNNQEYKRIDANIRGIQIPLNVIDGKTVRVQAISNNNNCYDSNFSEAKLVAGTSIGSIDLSKNGTEVSWNKITNATGYLMEISNSRYRKCVSLDDANVTSFDISTICEPGEYRIKLISLGQIANEGVTNIEYFKILETPENLVLNKDSSNLYFEQSSIADGYILTIKHYSSQLQQEVEKTIPYLYTSSPIDISDYLTEAQDYEFKLMAVNLTNKYISNSGLSEGKNFENVKTLTTPSLKVVQEDEEFYLQITSPIEEHELINKYEIWINYIKFDGIVLEDGRIKVTEHLQNAGRHNFMVRAIAIESEYLLDSNMASLSHPIYKQLSEVENIAVTHIEEESKYILSFDGQTMAGRYNIKIIKADDYNYDVEFSIQTSVVDISKYIADSGTYKIYVQAVARAEDEFYRSSEASGNPCIISKGTTLQSVENIKVTKDVEKEEINLSWNNVTNATGYRVQVYYNTNDLKTLKQTIFVPQSDSPMVNIGTGKYQALDKEGSYTIEIKAIGNDIYEASTIATSTYSHVMEMSADFERNTTFINGNMYSYKVDSVDTLKNLLWQHYLYNNETWRYDTLDYNLKVYCDLDLNALAQQISGIENELTIATTNAQKMNIIATALLNQYTEVLSYQMGFKDSEQNPIICLNEQENIYIFNYQSNIGNTQITETSNKIYSEKLDVVNSFDKRLSSYKFSIDKQDSMDVTTTEQLFMALQYNKQPNFVGDSVVAEAVYENARYILRQICSEQMTDYEKVLQIYNFLTKRVAWNYEAENKLSNINDSANMRELYLESILYNYNKPTGLFTTISETYSNNVQVSNLYEFVGVSSVSQGLSKAFVVLCSIEGIDSIKVNGKLNGKDYSWNKVYIDIEDDNIDGSQWYAVDLGSAIKNKMNIINNEYQVSTHKYFLVSDAQIDAVQTYYHAPLKDISYESVNSINYYTYQSYQSEYKGIKYTGNMTIVDGDDVKNIIKHAMISAKNQKVVLDMDAKPYLDSMRTSGQLNMEAVSNQIKNLHLTAMTELQDFVYNLSFSIVDDRYIVFAFEPVI